MKNETQSIHLVDGTEKMPKRHFSTTGHYVSGLNVALKAAFYPHYRYTRANIGPVHHSSSARPPGMLKTPKCRGKKVDRLVRQITERVLDGASVKQVMTSSWATSKCTPYVLQQLLPYLADERLTPIECQVEVYDDSAWLGTAIDLVCKADDGRMVVLEIKTGFDSYYDRHTDQPMNAPFGNVDDSPRWQHQLYLNFAVQLYETIHPGEVDRSRCEVVRMTADGLRRYPMVEWSESTIRDAWLALVNQNPSKRRRLNPCLKK